VEDNTQLVGSEMNHCILVTFMTLIKLLCLSLTKCCIFLQQLMNSMIKLLNSNKSTKIKH